MANNLQYSATLRNGQLDYINTALGTNAKLKIYTGTQPADVATAASGTLLVTMTCNSGGSAFAAASGGAVAKTGTWSAAATTNGTAGYFRMTTSGDTAVLQGTCGLTSGYDLNFDNTSISTSQTVTVDTCTITAGNA